jgi:hypothetical protein
MNVTHIIDSDEVVLITPNFFENTQNYASISGLVGTIVFNGVE